MAPVPDFVIAQDCDNPVLDSTLKVDNVPYNLTGATVTLSMKDANGKVVISDAACTLTDAPNGKVRFQFSVDQTAKPGYYTAEYHATISGGGKLKFPKPGTMLVYIEPKIK